MASIALTTVAACGVAVHWNFTLAVQLLVLAPLQKSPIAKYFLVPAGLMTVNVPRVVVTSDPCKFRLVNFTVLAVTE